MPTYQAPLRDMRFVLQELYGLDALQALPGLDELGADLADPVLEAAATFAEEVLQPLNRPGDEQGCRFEAGAVTTPKGFPAAYRAYAEAGWTALTCDPAHGGQGLPHALAVLVDEMACAANLSFALYPGLSLGAYEALAAHGSADLKATYLPRLAAGAWTGTMCLTEPQAGTDLGLVRTRAVPAADGSYRITGTKIFISAGEHDLAPDILHLVLARLPDAPPGSRGLSLFLVPKRRDGAPNGVVCGALEHKMGMKASATCVLNFDEATGWLVGAPHQGLAAMFTMMNTERLAVGIQGLGIAEAAYQGAVAYARDRLQGRSPTGARHPDKAADPILVHPDVRRMLLTQRAYVEGMRALGQGVARALDRRTRHPDPAERAAADDLVRLMTPVVKALFTDLGCECAQIGVQVFGGHGYIREHGMEQLVRDVRITQLYEGTNGVQAMDLVGRKLRDQGGRLPARFFGPADAFLEAHGVDPGLAFVVRPLAAALDRLKAVTAWLRDQADAETGAAGAVEYLRLFGVVALADQWARMAAAALPKAGGDDGGFYRAKLDTARFFMTRLLPQHEALAQAILAGGDTIRDFDDGVF